MMVGPSECCRDSSSLKQDSFETSLRQQGADTDITAITANNDAVQVSLSQGYKDSTDSAEKAEQEHQETGNTEEVEELKRRDREVRTHEQAHLAALGAYARGGATFEYTTGPDGKQYAKSGSVPVDLSTEKTPEETIRKAETVRRAALAPSEPSGADRGIAARATQMATKARKELTSEGDDPSGLVPMGLAESGSESHDPGQDVSELSPLGNTPTSVPSASSATLRYQSTMNLSTSQLSALKYNQFA